MRKKIKLHLGDKRLSYGGNIKRPYYLFIEMGEKQFVFSNKVKAKKWLVSFENKLNSLTKEMISYVPKLYDYNVKLGLYMRFSKQKRMREDLDYWLDRYYDLYNSHQVLSVGRDINGIFYDVYDQMEFYKKLLGKYSRNQTLLNQVKVDLKHLKYLRNDIDELFDVDKSLVALESKVDAKFLNLSENYLRIA